MMLPKHAKLTTEDAMRPKMTFARKFYQVALLIILI